MEPHYVVVCWVRGQRRFLSIDNRGNPSITEDFLKAHQFRSKDTAVVASLVVKSAYNVTSPRAVTVDEAQDVVQ